MIAFGHTAVGSALGLASYHYLGDQNPAIGLILTGAFGIISHYVADFIPHGHFFKSKEYKNRIFSAIILDLLASILLFLGLAYFQNGPNILFMYILFGIGGSQLPDILDGLMYIGLIPKKGLLKHEMNLHQAVHWHGKGDKTLIWSLFDIWQVTVVLLSLFLLLTY